MTRFRILTVVILTCISTLLMVACGQSSSRAWVEVKCDEFYEKQHLSGTIEVTEGEQFTVTLCSNPTTGFQWSESAQIGNESVLKQEDHEFIGPESKTPPPPGTPGQETWTFKGLKAGESTVYFEYSRPWQGGEKGEWTFELSVTIK